MLSECVHGERGRCDMCEADSLIARLKEERDGLASKLDTIRRGLNGVLVRNQNAEASDGDSMSVLHELFYQWFQREPPK